MGWGTYLFCFQMCFILNSYKEKQTITPSQYSQTRMQECVFTSSSNVSLQSWCVAALPSNWEQESAQINKMIGLHPACTAAQASARLCPHLLHSDCLQDSHSSADTHAKHTPFSKHPWEITLLAVTGHRSLCPLSYFACAQTLKIYPTT